MIFFEMPLVYMRTQVRMRLWPFDSEIHITGLLNHFLVCVTQNVGSRHNRSWKKKSHTQKVKFNLSRIPAVLPSPKWGQGSRNVCHDRLTDFVSRLWKLCCPRGRCCCLFASGDFSCDFRTSNGSLRSSEIQSEQHHKDSKSQAAEHPGEEQAAVSPVYICHVS